MKRTTLTLLLALAAASPAYASAVPEFPVATPQLEKAKAEMLALRFGGAHAAAEQQLKRTPEDFDAQMAMGRVQDAMGDYDEALDSYKKCVRLKGGDFRAQIMVAHAQLMLDHYDRARELCEELESHPGFKTAPAWYRSELYTTKGGALGIKSQREGVWAMLRYGLGVRHEFERSLELDPDNPRGLYALGRYFLEAPGPVGGDAEKGTALLTKATRDDPSDFVIRGYYVRGLLKTAPAQAKEEAGRFFKDFGELAEARKEFPDVVKAH